MSVLVEALTLVVPTKVLNSSYPGGQSGFCEDLLRLKRPPRFVCAGDPQLVNASFHDVDHLSPAVELLVEHGIVLVNDDRAAEAVCVDQNFGPIVPCDWLEWRRHEDGFTYAWLAGAEAGEMATPDGWTPQESRYTMRYEICGQPGGCIRLDSEDRPEYRLDCSLPRLEIAADDGAVAGEVQEPVVEEGESIADIIAAIQEGLAALDEPGDDAAGLDQDDDAWAVGTQMDPPLMPIVEVAIRRWGCDYELVRPEVLRSSIRGRKCNYQLGAVVNDTERVVVAYCVLGTRVAPEHRLAVADLLNRINWHLTVGSLELDLSDGEVRYRAGIDVGGGTLVPDMLESMLGMGLSVMERCHDAIIRVAFGAADPERALEAVCG